MSGGSSYPLLVSTLAHSDAPNHMQVCSELITLVSPISDKKLSSSRRLLLLPLRQHSLVHHAVSVFEADVPGYARDWSYVKQGA
jgi:hypothetical protein